MESGFLRNSARVGRLDLASIYQPMAAIVRERIKSSGPQPRDRIPSESETIRDHGVARDIARQAVAIL